MNALSWILDGSFSTRLTVTLLHFLWQGCVGGAVVLLVGWLLSHAAARFRYLLNVIVFLAMVCCLPVTFLIIDAPIVVNNEAALVQHNQAFPTKTALKVEGVDAATEQQLSERSPAANPTASIAIGPDLVPGTDRTPTSVSFVNEPQPGSKLSMRMANVSPRISRWVAAFYLGGVLLVLGRLLRGIRGGHRLRMQSTVIDDPALLTMVRQQANRLGFRVAPKIAWCEQISIPVVVGIVSPMILLPVAIASGLTPIQLQALLLHELSHIRRFDPIVNLLQRIIEALLFFHPMVWFVSRRISIERELSADDMVLGAGWDRPLYADALVRMAELAALLPGRTTTQHSAVLGATGSRPSEFKLRVLRLLEDPAATKLDISRTGLFVMLSLLVAGGTIAWSQSGRPVAAPASNLEQADTKVEVTKLFEDEIVISGRVVDSHGKPVPKALVVYPYGYVKAVYQTVTGEADTEGGFRLAIKKFDVPSDFKPGPLRTVWAWSKGHAIGAAQYLGPLNSSSNTRPGNAVSIQLPVKQQSVYVVKTESGEPLANAVVVPHTVRVPNGADPIDGYFGLYDRLPKAMLDVVQRVTDAEGRVVIDAVPHARFDQLEIVSKSHGTQVVRRRGRTEKEELVLRSPGRLTGQLVGGPEGLVRGVRLYFSTSVSDTEGTAVVTTDEDGAFDVSALAHGSLRIDTNLDPQQPWKLVGDHRFAVAAGATNKLILTLNKAIPVTGRLVVRGGVDPVDKANVYLRSGDLVYHDHLTTDERGEFHTFVIPGDETSVQVYGLATHPELASPETLHSKFTIPKNVDSFRIADIEIPKGTTWTGRLIDQFGRPVAGKYLQAWNGEKSLDHPERTDSDGAFKRTLRDDQIPDRWSVMMKWNVHNSEPELQSPAEIESKDPLLLRVIVSDEAKVMQKPAILLPDHWIVMSVGFDNSDTELVTASTQGFATIRRWDLVEKKLITEVMLESDKHGRFFRGETMMLSADRRKVIAATDEYIGIWETATGKLVKSLPIPKVGTNDTVRLLTCTPDFSVVAGNLTMNLTRLTLGYDAHSVVWDTRSNEAPRILTHKNQRELIQLSLTPDAKRLATTNGGGADIWDISSGKLLLHVPNDNSARKNDKPGNVTVVTDHVWSLQLSPDGRQLAMGDTLGVKLVDSTTGKLLKQLEGPYRYSSGLGPPGLVYSPDGQMLARLGTRDEGDYVVRIWSTKSEQKLFEVQTNANHAAFSADGRRLAVGFSDLQQALTVWPLDTDSKEPTQMEGPGPESRRDKVEQNGHYRGAEAAKFIEEFKPTWSATKNGIQYGIALTKQQNQFHQGERVPLVAFFRNAGDKAIKIDTRPDYYGNMPKITDANGTGVELQHVPLVGYISQYVETLQPGEAVGPFYFGFGLGENPRPGKQPWSPFWKAPEPGVYKLTHSVQFKAATINEDSIWTGLLDITSGQIDFEIVKTDL